MHGILRDLIGIDPSQWPEDIHMERTKIACLSSDILDQLIGILNTKDRRKSEETVNTPLNQRERRNIPRETANRSYQRSVAREGITGIVRYVMNSVFDLLRKEQQRINKERK
jgi:hypothetical protein